MGEGINETGNDPENRKWEEGDWRLAERALGIDKGGRVLGVGVAGVVGQMVECGAGPKS